MARKRPTRVTMQDVAREAGVSQSTVSFVLNRNPDVRIADDTKKRVFEVARRLRYPHRRSGRGRQQGSFIGFMVDEIATSVFAAISIEGAQEAAWNMGMVLDIAMSGGDRHYENTVLSRWIEEGVKGVIYASILTRNISPPPMLDPVPTVLLNCHADGSPHTAVVPAEVLGGYAATEALITAGHRRIGFIGGESWMEAARDRLEGYRSALISNGRRVDDRLIADGNFLPTGGYAGTHRLMALSAPPDAIFCASDLMAVGAYEALKELGRRIPEDVAIMGYDDQEIARHLNPPLSTVLLPHREMGQWAVDFLATRPARQRVEPRVVKLECPLVLRASH